MQIQIPEAKDRGRGSTLGGQGNQKRRKRIGRKSKKGGQRGGRLDKSRYTKSSKDGRFRDGHKTEGGSGQRNHKGRRGHQKRQ
jgi:hypothetical protein